MILSHSHPSVNSEKFPAGSLPERMDGLLPIASTWETITSAHRASAVLLLIIPPALKNNQSQIVFIRRSSNVGSHRGQIGFPGGRRERSDVSPSETALRETDEELGIAPDQVNVIGMLPKVTSLDGMPVIPIVGIAPITEAAMHPEPSEVEHVFAIEWTNFTPEKYQRFNMNIFGIRRQSGMFFTQGLIVWGLTAHVLCTACLG